MRELIMVYNADSGYFNAIADGLHKVFSPSTYSCNLCAITHGAVSMKNEWRRFIDSLDVPVTFLHRDEFIDNDWARGITLPAILIRDNDSDPTVLVDSEMINSATTIEDLQSLINAEFAKASTT